MLAALAVAIVLTLLFTAALYGKVSAQSRTIRAMEITLDSIRNAQAELSDLSALPSITSPVLEGKRIALQISQDHKLPILEGLIKERLESDDAVVLETSEGEVEKLASATKWDPAEVNPHVVVTGAVRCNGYKDVYYEADLTFLFFNGVVSSILEAPPNGSRQANLAIGVVKNIKSTLEQSATRAERQAAIKELNHP